MPVGFEQLRRVSGFVGVFDAFDEICERLVNGRITVRCEGIHAGELRRGAGGINIADIVGGDLRDHDAAVHLVPDQALPFENAGGLADGVARHSELGGERGFAKWRTRRYPAREDRVADRAGGLCAGRLALDRGAGVGEEPGHGRRSPSGMSCPAPCCSASRATSAAMAASWIPSPVRSATVSSSSAARPGSRPDAIAPSSPYTAPTSNTPAVTA